MTCEQDRPLLAAYFDGELSQERKAIVERHLRGCTTCAAEIAGLASMRRELNAARARYAPTAEFRRKIQSQMAVKDRPSIYLRFLWPGIAVVAVTLLCVVWLREPARPSNLSEVADLHVNALASANPVDVISTDRHTVKPWFQGKIPFSFNLPEFGGTDFTLVGGRLVYLHQQPGAQLIVAMRQHKMSVLILQESPELARSFARSTEVHQLSFNIETLSSHGLRFFVVGDAEPGEIEKLAQMLRAANPTD
jgi:anti-sigma factor RsiW